MPRNCYVKVLFKIIWGIFFFCSAPTKELSQNTTRQGSHKFIIIIIIIIIIITNKLPKGKF